MVFNFFYKIDYDGEYPKALLKAYEKIEELNDQPPRKKFKKDRKENKSADWFIKNETN